MGNELKEVNKFYPSMKSSVDDANADPFLMAKTVHSICDFPLLDEINKYFPMNSKNSKQVN